MHGGSPLPNSYIDRFLSVPISLNTVNLCIFISRNVLKKLAILFQITYMTDLQPQLVKLNVSVAGEILKAEWQV